MKLPRLEAMSYINQGHWATSPKPYMEILDIPQTLLEHSSLFTAQTYRLLSLREIK